MEKDLKGHRALITGASSGIGEEYARQLSARGADLVISARRLDRLQKLASELQAAYHVQVDCIQADLSVPGEAERLFKSATSLNRAVTILVNNAGIGKWREFWKVPLEDHQRTMQINMIAPTELTYLCVRHMLEHQHPSFITNVSSIATFQPVTNFAVYSGTKVYFTHFSEILSSELKDTPIRLSCLCPGGTLTEFLDNAGQKLTPQGKWGMMTAKKVAAIGINGMLRGERVIVPGIANQIICFLPRLLPRQLSLWIGSKVMKKAIQSF